MDVLLSHGIFLYHLVISGEKRSEYVSKGGNESQPWTTRLNNKTYPTEKGNLYYQYMEHLYSKLMGQTHNQLPSVVVCTGIYRTSGQGLALDSCVSGVQYSDGDRAETTVTENLVADNVNSLKAYRSNFVRVSQLPSTPTLKTTNCRV